MIFTASHDGSSDNQGDGSSSLETTGDQEDEEALLAVLGKPRPRHSFFAVEALNRRYFIRRCVYAYPPRIVSCSTFIGVSDCRVT